MTAIPHLLAIQLLYLPNLDAFLTKLDLAPTGLQEVLLLSTVQTVHITGSVAGAGPRAQPRPGDVHGAGAAHRGVLRPPRLLKVQTGARRQ